MQKLSVVSMAALLAVACFLALSIFVHPNSAAPAQSQSGTGPAGATTTGSAGGLLTQPPPIQSGGSDDGGGRQLGLGLALKGPLMLG